VGTGGVVLGVLLAFIAAVMGYDMHRLRHPLGYWWAGAIVLGPIGVLMWLLTRVNLRCHPSRT
jgi:multisubunit Na+/H+ antiporter MnhB subunit